MGLQFPLDRTKVKIEEDKEDGIDFIIKNPEVLNMIQSSKGYGWLWENKPFLHQYFNTKQDLEYWGFWTSVRLLVEKNARDIATGKTVPIKKSDDYIEHRGYPFSTYKPKTLKGVIKSGAQVALAGGAIVGAIGAIIAAGAGEPEAAAALSLISGSSAMGFLAYPLTKLAAMKCADHVVDSYDSYDNNLHGFWDKARFKIRKILTLALGSFTILSMAFSLFFQPYNAKLQAKDDNMIGNYSESVVFENDYINAKNALRQAYENKEISFADYEKKMEYLESEQFQKDSFMKNASDGERAEYEKAVAKAEKSQKIADTTGVMTVAAVVAQPLQSEPLKELES